MEIKINEELSNLLPEMQPDEFESLKDDIFEHDLSQPIIVDEDGTIVDGHHRFRACQELGIELTEDMIKVVPGLTMKEKLERAIGLNLKRRHLSREQRDDMIRNFKIQYPDSSNREISKIFGVDDHTVKKILEGVANAEIPQMQKTTGADGKNRPSSEAQAEQQRQEITEMVIEHPKMNNHQIALTLGASDHTVKKVREEMGSESKINDDLSASVQQENEEEEPYSAPYSLNSSAVLSRIILNVADSTIEWLHSLIYDCSDDPGKEAVLSSKDGAEAVIKSLTAFKETVDKALDEAVAHLQGQKR